MLRAGRRARTGKRVVFTCAACTHEKQESVQGRAERVVATGSEGREEVAAGWRGRLTEIALGALALLRPAVGAEQVVAELDGSGRFVRSDLLERFHGGGGLDKAGSKRDAGKSKGDQEMRKLHGTGQRDLLIGRECSSL